MNNHLIVEQLSAPVLTTLALSAASPSKVLKMHVDPASASVRFEVSTKHSCQFFDTLEEAVKLYNEY